jgi:hypothetical protein
MIENLIIFMLINYTLGWIVAYFIDNSNNAFIPSSELESIAESMRGCGFFITMILLALYQLVLYFINYLNKKR